MRPLRNAALLLFTLALCTTSTLCQSLDAASLKGIHSVSIAIDGTVGNPCGISQDDITTSVKFIVGQSPLRIVGHSTFNIYVSVIVMDDCTASSVSVQVLAPATIDGTGVWDAAATVWGKAGLLTGPNQRTRVLEQIEADCKTLVVDWNSVNHK